MKRFLPALFLLTTTYSFAQEHPDPTIGEVISIDEGQELKGERAEFTQYYDRATKLIIDSAAVSFRNSEGSLQKVIVKPTETNGYWKEIGSFFPFSGKASVIGVKIGYHQWTQYGPRADLFDLTLYQEAIEGSEVPEEILATQSFFGYLIETTGPDLSSFTYIEFDKNQFTDVERGFMVGLAIEDVSPQSDEMDAVRVFTSSRGDGLNESRAMVKLNAGSELYTNKEFVPMDEVFLDVNGQRPFEWNWDIMIIPVMDIDEVGIGYVDLNGGRFNGHFPNPARDQFTIDLDLEEHKDNIQISVQTMSGQTMKTMNTGSLGIGKHFLSVDISGLAAGSYIYTVDEGSSGFTGRVIVVD